MDSLPFKCPKCGAMMVQIEEGLIVRAGCSECDFEFDGLQSAVPIQNQIAKNVDDRGYFKGWDPAQILARQLVKLGEELPEGMAHVRTGALKTRPWWLHVFEDAEGVARQAFDGFDEWEHTTIDDLDALGQELADMQVILCCAAYAYELLTGQPFDLMAGAYLKSLKDIKRGRREQGK